MSKVDVAVVGCGPVGAMAALLLARQGVEVVVLEAAAAPHPLPRAVHIDHEMMRLFQSAGVIDRLQPLMRETQGHLHIGADGGVIRYMGTVGCPKRFGWANDYFFYQPELEQALREALAITPTVTLRLGARVDGLTQDADVAHLHVASVEGGMERITARYVIACDGARSTLRKALGIELDDLQFEEPWLVIDADVNGPIVFPDIPGLPAQADLQQLSVMLCDPRRPATIVPGRGRHRRWEFMLLPGEDDTAMMHPDAVAGLIAPWVKGASYDIVRAATYRFHGLVAERWRGGRVFLAGDAAHQTPPFFGQGMCHGFRDVANLAWKLGLVCRGEATTALLDTYQPERDPHVRAVIEAAVGAGRYICELDPKAAAARDLRMREAMAGAAPTTAADLIPPIREGVVHSGGERFIQPRVQGGTALLDDVTGGGFRLLARSENVLSCLSAKAQAVLQRLDVGCWTLAALGAETGDVAAWFDAQDVDVVVLRPDFYVFGTALKSGASGLVLSLAERLGLNPVASERSLA